MGYKTTYDIERSTALQVIVNKLAECSNDELSNMLLEFDESNYRNYKVYDHLPDDSVEYAIKNYDEF